MSHRPYVVSLLLLASLTACGERAGSEAAPASSATSGKATTFGWFASSLTDAPTAAPHPDTSAGSVGPSSARTTDGPGALTAAHYLCHDGEGDDVCSAAEYAANRTAMAAAETRNGTPGSTTFDPRLDALAAGGPTMPAEPADHDSTTCRVYATKLDLWARYQNAHRPSAAARVPTSKQNTFVHNRCRQVD